MSREGAIHVPVQIHGIAVNSSVQVAGNYLVNKAMGGDAQFSWKAVASNMLSSSVAGLVRKCLALVLLSQRIMFVMPSAPLPAGWPRMQRVDISTWGALANLQTLLLMHSAMRLAIPLLANINRPLNLYDCVAQTMCRPEKLLIHLKHNGQRLLAPHRR